MEEEPTPNLLELEEKTVFETSKAIELIDKFLSSYLHQKEKNMTETENYSLSGWVMVPSYISRLPTGSETGIYLAMGLNSTNLKLTAVRLLGPNETELEHDRELKIPDDLKVGTVENLFDWIALNAKDLELLVRQSNNNKIKTKNKIKKDDENEKNDDEDKEEDKEDNNNNNKNQKKNNDGDDDDGNNNNNDEKVKDNDDDNNDDNADNNKELLLYMSVNYNFPIK